MTKRLFIAVRYIPSNEIKELIGEFKLKLIDENIKWVVINDIHLTLRFLGDVDLSILPELTKVLEKISMNVDTFNLEVIGTGAFFRGKYPSIIFLNLKPNNILINLVDRISDAILKLGFIKEERNFKAHITLGRVKYLDDVDLFNDLLNIECKESFKVESIDLYESKLTPKGPKYSILKEFALRSLKE